jgi:biopolymer transport protein ExbD
MKIKTPPLKRARIEIIPMIDTIFFLLVFFMIASLSMVKMKAIGLNVPRAASGSGSAARGAPDEPVMLTVDDTGAITVNHHATNETDLSDAIASALKNNQQGVIVVNIAKTRSAQTLINVLDKINAVKVAGHPQIKTLVATQQVDANGQPIRGGN